MFTFQYDFGQCKVIIVQEGKKCDLMNDLTVMNYQDVSPTRINDSTIEFTYNITEPEHLYVLLDGTKHGDTSMMFNWKTRFWISPNVRQRKVFINYSTKVVRIVDVVKSNLHEWDSIVAITGHLDDFEKYTEELNIITPYVEKHPDSYLSLWFFMHSHALYIESADKKLVLFNKLNPVLQKYADYQNIKSDLTGRKYPNTGDAFKEFTLTDVSGKAFNSTTIKNKWILLHFWSNTCGPCIKEMDAMVSYYKTLDTAKIVFISVSLDDNRDKWKKASTTNKIKWTNVWESGGMYGDLCLTYNLPAMPFFVLFNSEKKLIVMQDGADALDTTIKGYLSKVK
jgi:thiol-disulfide isomerase/thioredoxin